MLREKLTSELKNAMLAKDAKRTAAIRLIVAGMKEKDVVARGNGNKEASEADLMSMMQTMIKQRKDSIKMYQDGGRPELAQKEQDEIDVIETFLPKQMGEAEVEAAIKSVMAEIGASSIKDMGKVMAGLKEKYAGSMDFGAASAKIKALLQ